MSSIEQSTALCKMTPQTKVTSVNGRQIQASAFTVDDADMEYSLQNLFATFILVSAEL
jgi:hypothetical protein